MKPEQTALVVARDLLMRARLERAVRDAGYRARTASDLTADAGDVGVLVVDLDQDGMLEAVEAWRRQVPDGRVVGLLSHVDRERRIAAERLHVEVLPRGGAGRVGELLARDG